ncbi:MAG TPA: hypothetical protein VIM11_23305 [Tepidisphaeraceae bacterium]|jgi:hypothetical protein
MPLPVVILLAGTGFLVTGLLGLIRIILPLRAIDRTRLRLLSYMLALGMGVDDAAIARIARVPNAESMLEEMSMSDPKAIFPKLALDMLRARRPKP